MTDHDPTTAQRLQGFYDDKIAFVFQHHIRPNEYQSLFSGGLTRIRGLLNLSHGFFDDALKYMGPAPPGLGDQALAGKPALAGSGTVVLDQNFVATLTDFWLIALEHTSTSDSPAGEHVPAWERENHRQRNLYPVNDWASIYRPTATSTNMNPYGTHKSTDSPFGNFGAVGQGKPAPKLNKFLESDDSRSSMRYSPVKGPTKYTETFQDYSRPLLDVSNGRSAPEGIKTERELAMRDLERRLEELRARPLKDSTNILPAAPSNGLNPSPTSRQSQAFSHEQAWLDGLKNRNIQSRPTFEEALNSGDPRSLTPPRDFVLQPSPPSSEERDGIIRPPTTTGMSGSWAKVAAIPEMTTAPAAFTADSHFANHGPRYSSTSVGRPRTISQVSAGGSSKPLHLRELSSGSTGEEGAVEPYESQLRVVWLFNVPPSYTALQVSRHITSGPLFSLSMETNVAPHVPGLSACIIFAASADAKAFLLAQNCSVAFPAATANQGIGSQEEDASDVLPAPETSQNAGTRTAYARDGAPNATLQLGNPYPIATHTAVFAAMRDPHRQARRRVKWARARLFHCVPLGTFKRDVLRLVRSAGAGTNAVELWHFYNPGECTVVFSSVAVAMRVVAAFQLWSRAKVPKSGAAGLKRGAGEVEKVRADGRYVGVEVAFCKDFNEAPPGKLVSSYGPSSGVGVAEGVKGYEGAFEGPRVRVDVL